ncbi:DoxX family protein [Actinomadura bangladeshensis]|uniref:DoxX family protein n=1 Tax=Actinomadura bangladeshensis TaxID=453573 RepID=A0A6L9QG16_9ACTN|nr:DoxX family protein [Actinomadura bangladeshensis]NEA23044.1 DoxX family protein [Actinomadura bangladeshensis]
MTVQTAHTAPATTASTTATDNAGHGTRRKVLWGAQILLAAFLLIGSGLPKLVGQADAVETFELIGWGQWFRYVTGVIEVAGAVGLVIPRLAGLAATALIGLMAGAVLTQILVIEPAWSILPAAFAVVFAAIAHDRRAETRQVLRSLKR